MLISAVMALLGLALDLMLPAFDDIRMAFDLEDGSGQVGQVITVFFLGLAAAQVIYGPLADRFGRKPVLYIGITIYLIGAVGSAYAPSFAWLLASRFVWGLGAAGSRVVATAIIRDHFEGIRMAKAMSQIMAVFILVPVIAPAIGTGIVAVLPWRGVFWFCFFWAVVVGVWSLRLHETLDPAHRRPLSLRESTGGFVQVARTPVTGGYIVAGMFLQGVFTAYLASSEQMITEIFGLQGQFPLVFGSIAIMFWLAAILNGRFVSIVGVEGLILRVLMVQFPLTLVLIAVSVIGDGTPNFWVFMPLVGLMLSTFMFLMPNLNTAAMGPVGELAGTASALSGATRMAGGAVLGTIIVAGIDTSVTPFAVGAAVMSFCTSITVGVVRWRQR
jgi:DHA1 family bicyclomycin/chloramphenicol resistance-like MFS transporter